MVILLFLVTLILGLGIVSIGAIFSVDVLRHRRQIVRKQRRAARAAQRAASSA